MSETETSESPNGSSGAAPEMLIDPDGEGVYFHTDVRPSGYLQAARMFFGTAKRWREIDSKVVFMQPSETRDEWVPANVGRFPRYWRLNLPRRWTGIEVFAYYTPKQEAM